MKRCVTVMVRNSPPPASAIGNRIWIRQTSSHHRRRRMIIPGCTHPALLATLWAHTPFSPNPVNTLFVGRVVRAAVHSPETASQARGADSPPGSHAKRSSIRCYIHLAICANQGSPLTSLLAGPLLLVRRHRVGLSRRAFSASPAQLFCV